jgi:hypothetical protein
LGRDRIIYLRQAIICLNLLLQAPISSTPTLKTKRRKAEIVPLEDEFVFYSKYVPKRRRGDSSGANYVQGSSDGTVHARADGHAIVADVIHSSNQTTTAICDSDVSTTLISAACPNAVGKLKSSVSTFTRGLDALTQAVNVLECPSTPSHQTDGLQETCSVICSEGSDGVQQENSNGSVDQAHTALGQPVISRVPVLETGDQDGTIRSSDDRAVSNAQDYQHVSHEILASTSITAFKAQIQPMAAAKGEDDVDSSLPTLDDMDDSETNHTVLLNQTFQEVGGQHILPN